MSKLRAKMAEVLIAWVDRLLPQGAEKKVTLCLSEGAGAGAQKPVEPRLVRVEGFGYVTRADIGSAQLSVTDWCVRLSVNGVAVGSWSIAPKDRA